MLSSTDWSTTMATQQAFMPYFRNAPFDLASTSTSSVTLATATANPQSSFRAPAHRHAHHLHSIPPREKSTRTLIIDHMLWVHGRTRFAQARAELGMTDRTGGPSSLNYVSRARPEGYEEEEEEDSEGEEVSALKARIGNPNHPMNDEDDRLRRQDLSLARSLRLRAEGVEKVISSMLDQPPPIHPFTDDDLSKNNRPDLKDLHRLPNGVRLRLALGTIINDLFARQSFHAPYRHIQMPNLGQDLSPITTSPSDLPGVLLPLAPVSGAFVLPTPSPITLRGPSYSEYTAQYPQPSSTPTQIAFQTFHHQPSLTDRNSIPHPSQRTREIYFSASDPSANRPPAFRCPRHLRNGCEICTEELSSQRQAANIPRSRSGQSGVTSRWKPNPGPGIGGITGWQEDTGIGSGLLRPAVRGSALRRTVIENDMTAGAGNTNLSKLIPRFLRLSALIAAELGREARGEEMDSLSEDGRINGVGGDNDVGMMAAGDSPSANVGTPGRSPWNGGKTIAPSSPMMRKPGQNSPENQARERARMYEKALRPSREWYMLLAGLLTRAVLEGYLTAGWSGLQAVQCLLLVGLGINENLNVEDADSEDEDALFASFDPDELPDLLQAVKILFPGSRVESYGVKDQAEEEYGTEMMERLRKFCEIPLSAPDWSIQMEGLSWQYPAETVERASVRYCEAIARWRGKPELETYKKKPPSRPTTSGDLVTTPGGTSPMTIESLVHSNPTSPNHPNRSARGRGLRTPSIDLYFPRGQTVVVTAAGGGGSVSSPVMSNPNPLGTKTIVGSGTLGAGSAGTTWIPSIRASGKRYREVEDVGRVEDAKRMYTG